MNISRPSDQLQISILNASTGRVDQIQQSGSLDPSTVWTQRFLGTPGVTNFILTPLSNSNQFFRAYLVPGTLPQIVSFTASPATLPTTGGVVTLRWSIVGATGLSLSGIGDVTGTTSRVINVTSTRIFTLTATNNAGSVTNQTAAVVGVLATAHNGRFVSFVSPITGHPSWPRGSSASLSPRETRRSSPTFPKTGTEGMRRAPSSF